MTERTEMSDLAAGRIYNGQSVYVRDNARKAPLGCVTLFNAATGQEVTFSRRDADPGWSEVDAPQCIALYRRWQVSEREREIRESRARATEGRRLLEKQATEQARAAERRRTLRAREFQTLAVFARNHPHYLAKACKLELSDPGHQITFRSRQKWATAACAVDLHGPVPLYFATIGGRPLVTHEALLEYVALNPRADTKEVAELLRHELPGGSGVGTQGEALWDVHGNRARTLYVISGCRAIPPFAMSDLRRWKEVRRLSQNYRYSYALVVRRT